MGRKTDNQIHETARTPNILNPQRDRMGYIELNFQKSKTKRIFKSQKQSNKRKETCLIQVKSHKIVDFSAETWKSRKEWNDIFRILGKKSVNEEC